MSENPAPRVTAVSNWYYTTEICFLSISIRRIKEGDTLDYSALST